MPRFLGRARVLGSSGFSPGVTDGDILSAYEGELGHLMGELAYGSCDVVRLQPDASDPDWPSKASAARARFLAEHRHAEHEVRFFVAGSGLFALRLGSRSCPTRRT